MGSIVFRCETILFATWDSVGSTLSTSLGRDLAKKFFGNLNIPNFAKLIYWKQIWLQKLFCLKFFPAAIIWNASIYAIFIIWQTSSLLA